MNRRQFLKTGVVGGAVLATGAAWMSWRDHDSSNTAGVVQQQQRRIDRIIGAIAPVILAGALPADAAARSQTLQRVSEDVSHVIAHFTPPVRSEVHELFALLDIGVARRLLTGITSDWPHADPADVTAFLERWHRSYFATLQSGYHALHDLVLGAFYASPATWTSIGYAGPPQL